MTDNNKKPIDLLKWRVDKLLEQERRKEDTREQLEWSGTEFAAEIEGINLSEEVLKGVKTFMCTIAKRMKEAKSIQEVERLFLGLGLLLLRDYDSEAFEKLLNWMKDDLKKE